MVKARVEELVEKGFIKVERFNPFRFDRTQGGFVEIPEKEINEMVRRRYPRKEIKLVVNRKRKDESPLVRLDGDEPGKMVRVGEPTTYWLDVYVKDE